MSRSPGGAQVSPGKGRFLGSALGALTGGLSLFKLGSALWNLELAQLMGRIVEVYEWIRREVFILIANQSEGLDMKRELEERYVFPWALLARELGKSAACAGAFFALNFA